MANKVADSGDAVASANSGEIVKAVHIEPQAPELETANAPSLLAGLSAGGSIEAPRSGCEAASQVLGEAIKTLKTKLAVIGNNLANADTVAFKRSRVAVESCPYEQLKLPGAQDAFNNYAPASIAVGRGCRVQSVELDFAQGPLKETGRSLDVAIEGDGLFQVIDPSTNNFLYTRAGNFAVNSNGLLVLGSASTGRLVQPQISIPINTIGIVISDEGNVSIQQFGQPQYSQIGQLQLAKFMNPQGLLLLGENLYQETLASGPGTYGQPGLNGLGKLRQKALERSNVDLDEEVLAWKTTERTLQSIERLLGPTRRYGLP
ncbi:MAG TPA: flagellar hook-basal body complex protein [Pirellulales bacterium]|nr:flagellar hook-basal body complex protein [Pirellulales bacterium]